MGLSAICTIVLCTMQQSLAEEISVLKQRIEELEQKLSSEILLPGATRSSLSLLLGMKKFDPALIDPLQF